MQGIYGLRSSARRHPMYKGLARLVGMDTPDAGGTADKSRR